MTTKPDPLLFVDKEPSWKFSCFYHSGGYAVFSLMRIP